MGWLTPTYRLRTVLELTPQWVEREGIAALLLDVDCTLKRYLESRLAPEVVQWCDRLRGAGVKLCLVSNGGGRRLKPLADDIAIPLVALAMKPLPFGCRRALRLLSVPRDRALMVGDQLFADVLAGRWAGVRTALVEPLSPEEEPWFTRLKRPLEQRLVRRLPFATECKTDRFGQNADRVRLGISPRPTDGRD